MEQRMNTCTECTKELLTEANYCPICGEVIESNEEAAAVDRKAFIDEVSLDQLQIGKVDRQSASIFIQKHQQFYFDSWKKGDSWNWAAFFFISFWLGYRKMYRHLFMLIGFWIVYDAFIMMMFSHMPLWSSLLAFIAPAGYLGAKGNDLYKSHMIREITCIDRQELSGDIRMKCIKKAGGTAITGIVYAVLLAMGYLFFFSYT